MFVSFCHCLDLCNLLHIGLHNENFCLKLQARRGVLVTSALSIRAYRSVRSRRCTPESRASPAPRSACLARIVRIIDGLVMRADLRGSHRRLTSWSWFDTVCNRLRFLRIIIHTRKPKQSLDTPRSASLNRSRLEVLKRLRRAKSRMTIGLSTVVSVASMHCLRGL